jgi:hypothetical protein
MKTKRKSRKPADPSGAKLKRASSKTGKTKKAETTRKVAYDEEGNDFKWTPSKSSVASDEEL